MKRGWFTRFLTFLGGIVFFILVLFLLLALLPLIKSFDYGKPKIGILEVKGLIVEAEEYLSAVKEFMSRSDIKGVLVRIDSPGGAIGPTQEVYEELKKLRKLKPVYVSMGGISASGGYYLALAGEKIFANPGTITGSIGVLIEIPNLEKLLDKLGIKGEVIKSGEYKDTGTIFRSLTPKERQYLEDKVKQLHQQFIKVVAMERSLPIEKVEVLADGRIYTGEEAKKLGLIDELGNYHTALEELKKRLGLKEIGVISLPRKKSFWERLLEEKSSLRLEKLLESLSYQPFFLMK